MHDPFMQRALQIANDSIGEAGHLPFAAVVVREAKIIGEGVNRSRLLHDPTSHGEIEAVAVDDGLGYVYYADEERSIHKWHADPDAPGANRELAEFGMDGFAGDREGIVEGRRGGATGGPRR